MFELVMDQLPELQRLEQAVANIERERTEALGRHAQLVQEVAAVREDDLNRVAAALNAGKKPPKPREPQLRSQLEGVERELEVLERRLALAQADRARFIQSNHERLAGLLAEAQASEGERVAEGASQVLADLLRYFQAEDDIRALRRLVPAPVEENVGAPARTTAVWGPMTTRTVTGGPPRGDLEGTLRYLESLGETTVVGEDSEAGAA
jgi:DNA repair exonuclease SbcCD ATPase subunit